MGGWICYNCYAWRGNVEELSDEDARRDPTRLVPPLTAREWTRKRAHCQDRFAESSQALKWLRDKMLPYARHVADGWPDTRLDVHSAIRRAATELEIPDFATQWVQKLPDGSAAALAIVTTWDQKHTPDLKPLELHSA
ncbi:MAG: hypothetical protein ACRDXX_01165 [Stackebrandtia sp.]